MLEGGSGHAQMPTEKDATDKGNKYYDDNKKTRE